MTRTLTEIRKSKKQMKKPIRYEDETNSITNYFNINKSRRAAKLMKAVSKIMTDEETSKNTEETEYAEGDPEVDTEGESGGEQTIDLTTEDAQISPGL